MAERGWGFVGFSLFGCFFHRLSRRVGGREPGDEHGPGTALQPSRQLPRARSSAVPGEGNGLDEPSARGWINLRAAGLYLRNRAPSQGSFVPDAGKPKSGWDPAGTRGAGQLLHQDQALLWKTSLAGCLTPGHTLRNSPALPSGTVTLPSHPQPPLQGQSTHTPQHCPLPGVPAVMGDVCPAGKPGLGLDPAWIRSVPLHSMFTDVTLNGSSHTSLLTCSKEVFIYLFPANDMD